MENQELKPYMMSLFEYLGYAAGNELGKRVHDAATKLREPIQTKEVKTRTYNGLVCLYRREFLKEYFATVKSTKVEPSLGDRQDYNL